MLRIENYFWKMYKIIKFEELEKHLSLRIVPWTLQRDAGWDPAAYVKYTFSENILIKM